MATVSVVYWQPVRRAYGSNRSAWSKGRQPPGAVLHHHMNRVNSRYVWHHHKKIIWYY